MIAGPSSRAMPNGLLAINKPWGWSSHDVVATVRRASRTSAVGHAGTLDPLASGVLVVALGTATRVLDTVMDLPKCYVAEIRLGVTSATDDAEGPVLAERPALAVTPEQIETALAGLIGDLEQLPPTFAAIKVAGQPAYASARQGKDVTLAARRVTIYALAVLRLRLPALTLAIWCAKGTYIRALARDLGAILGTGAYVTGLVRMSIGPFALRDSLSLADIDRLVEAGRLADFLYPPETALTGRPVLLACGAAAQDLRHGRSVAVENMAPPADRQAASWALDPAGRLLALGDWQFPAPTPQPNDDATQSAGLGTHSVWHPRKVFAPC